MGKDATQYRMLHFATHAILDNDIPELSSIVLSQFDENGNAQDGRLYAFDISDLKLRSDTVVLSACQTAYGRQVRGEGLQSMTRAFMAAGARNVIASLWSVPDDATAELMERFYYKKLVDKRSAVEALQAAQESMQASVRWSNPFYWAGFIVQGDWLERGNGQPSTASNSALITDTFEEEFGPGYSREFPAVSPDGKWTIAEYIPGDRADEGIARLRELRQKTVYNLPISKYARIWEFEAVVPQVEFSPQSDWLVKKGDDGVVTLYRLSEGHADIERPTHLKTQARTINEIQFSSDEHWLVTGNDENSFQLWNMAEANSQTQPIDIPGGEFSTTIVRFSDKGHWLATVGWRSSNALLWDLHQDHPKGSRLELPNSEAPIHWLGFSPDDRWLMAISDDKVGVSLWDLNSSRPGVARYSNLCPGHNIDRAMFSDDSKWVALSISDPADKRGELSKKTLIGYIGAATGKPVWSDMLESITFAGFSPDSRWLLTRGTDGTHGLWDLSSASLGVSPYSLGRKNQSAKACKGCETEPAFGPEDPITGIPSQTVFSDDGRWLLLQSRGDPDVYLWDLRAGKTAMSPCILQSTGALEDVRFSRDGSWLALNTDDGTVFLYPLDIKYGIAKPSILHDQTFKIDQTAFALDDKYLVTWSSDRKVRLWSLERVKRLWYAKGGS